MSATLIATSAAVATAATVVAATMPEAHLILAPFTSGAEHTALAVSLLFTLPVLTVLALVATRTD